MIADADFGGIDYTVRSGGDVNPEKVKEELPRAVEAAHAAGLKVEMISTNIVRANDPHTLPIGEGVVDFAQYFRLVRELMIGGPCSVHLEYPPFEGGPKHDLAEKNPLASQA